MNETELVYVVIASTQERYGIRKAKAAPALEAPVKEKIETEGASR